MHTAHDPVPRLVQEDSDQLDGQGDKRSGGELERRRTGRRSDSRRDDPYKAGSVSGQCHKNGSRNGTAAIQVRAST